MDHHSRLIQEKLPKNRTGATQITNQEIKAKNYDLTPEAKSQYT